ncbi:hypothetical protein [Methylocaldum gracile]|uniref:hypothetical protein n=1 Tax=Methylocaldum sp. 0917 TaxID=2485163 RepID=UPI00105CACFF
MITNNLLEVLDAEVASFPSRASGEQLYAHISKIAARYVASERQEVISAVTEWLILRSEPKTMLAVDIAGKFRLAELRPVLEKLLVDVEQGKAFKPFYARPIKAVLAMI